MMRSRFSRPLLLNAQNRYAAYLAVSALLDVLLDSDVACLERTCLDFLGTHMDGHPLRCNQSRPVGPGARGPLRPLGFTTTKSVA